MARSRALSGQARSLLAVLAEAGGAWRHGYELARLTGLGSGTLYPLLLRLEGQGYLDAQWQPPAIRGRPARHAYRLTAAGLALARSQADERPAPAGPRQALS